MFFSFIFLGLPLTIIVHKQGFKDFVRQLKDATRPDGYIISLTVLPNVNTTVHYDVPNIINQVDFVTLAAFDYQTWERNPYEADYSAPIHSLHDRIPESNLDYQIGLWLSLGAPAYKIVAGIPAHGRSWQLTTESTKTGVPPILDVKQFNNLHYITIEIIKLFFC